MTSAQKPLVICVPEPRTLDLIFQRDQLARLRSRYTLIETTEDRVADLDESTLGAARYILGQPPLSGATLAKLTRLRAVLNVESNLLDNMPYDEAFARGIHILTAGGFLPCPWLKSVLVLRSTLRGASVRRTPISGPVSKHGAAMEIQARGC